MTRTYTEINEKIKNGTAVVLTAKEVSELAKTCSPKEIAERVDVVTTATFGAMCSSGAFLNFGHANPPIRMEKIELNGIRVCGGLAAVDTYIGATDCNPENPTYGGAHLIEDLIAGKEITLEAWGKGTDCYPRKHIKTKVTKDTVNEAYLYNPRNAYQNYNVATNSTDQIKYTYMGTLLPKLRNAAYSTAGELSPLINDPECRTIGLGTRIFLCGTEGYVAWNGTQFHSTKEVNDYGIPTSNARTLAVIGDLKNMSTEFLRGVYYEKYGVSLFVGIGIPIPILDEDMARRVSIRNEQIETTIVDYGNGNKILGKTNYAALQSGEIEIDGQKIRTAPVSSLSKAIEIANILKEWIRKGDFLLTEPVRPMPVGTSLKSLKEQE
ncbi:homocysteine biosynthesis protein [Gabonibacter massiliensis]|uniref:homocysteine biosynthesis protein n=1 Tax=Gabonibacter massiliensis TaxID=1720195 RepID=UPI00073EB0AA|nr:homocysteine biosynthesis protein [Gabonibacter massiliensis]